MKTDERLHTCERDKCKRSTGFARDGLLNEQHSARFEPANVYIRNKNNR